MGIFLAGFQLIDPFHQIVVLIHLLFQVLDAYHQASVDRRKGTRIGQDLDPEFSAELHG